jgi:hypothetical protein
MSGAATTHIDVRSTGHGAISVKQMVASLRAGGMVERVVDSGAVREIEKLSPEERWKIYRDLETFFRDRADVIEKSHLLP